MEDSKERLLVAMRETKDYLALTSERALKLEEFLGTEKFVGLEEYQQALLKMQCATMDTLVENLGTYLKILEQRLGQN